MLAFAVVYMLTVLMHFKHLMTDREAALILFANKNGIFI